MPGHIQLATAADNDLKHHAPNNTFEIFDFRARYVRQVFRMTPRRLAPTHLDVCRTELPDNPPRNGIR